MSDPNLRGRFFNDSDTFGWYLFLAEAFLDHVWNYEPLFGLAHGFQHEREGIQEEREPMTGRGQPTS